MLRNGLCILMFSMVVAILPAHSSMADEADSLKSALESAHPAERIEIFLQLSKFYESRDPVQSLDYARNAEKEAQAAGDYVLVGKAKNRIGVAFYFLDEIENSTKHFFESLGIFDSLKNYNEKARELNNIGWMYRTINRNEDALRYFKEGIALADKTDDKLLLLGLLNNLGTVYRFRGQYQEALEVYRQSMEHNRTLQNKQWEAYTMNNIGLIYFDQHRYNMAEKYFLDALEINKLIGSVSEQSRNMLNLALAYFEDNPDNKMSEYYFQKADSLISKNNLKKERLVYFEYHKDISVKKGDYKQAFESQLAYTKLQKELNYQVMEEKMATIDARYENEVKQRELELAIKKLSWQRFIIFTGTAVFILVVSILFLGMKMYKSKVRYSHQIENLAAELRIKNDDINRINENLENIVAERTKKLRLQNEKLVKYSFINSHDIRGPLARVLGLIYLFEKENDAAKPSEIFAKLTEAAAELDQVIKETSDLLQEDENFNE
ncbi:MAG: tetratricopeptide repeat protein [Cyclobacteriaceae bacterium]|nr:tetratricopeptide repeat protein [Cyclobacteriaceae bacterium]